MKTTDEPLRYTETEIRSFLPTGWALIGDSQGSWDADAKEACIVRMVPLDLPAARRRKREHRRGQAGRRLHR